MLAIRNESKLMGGDHPSTIVQFYLTAEKNEVESLEKKRPVHDEYEYIRIMFAGDNSKTVERRVHDGDKERFSAQYTAWLKGGEGAQSGTPLTELKFMNSAIMADLSYQRVTTVEALANLSDTALQQIGMGARDWKLKAEQYLRDTAGNDAAAVKQLAQDKINLQDDIKALQTQMKDLASRLEESERKKK